MSGDASTPLEHLFLAAPPGHAPPADRDVPPAWLGRWIEALAREARMRADGGWLRARRLRTIHVGGGGAPSALGPMLPAVIRERLLGGGEVGEEFSVEARARDLTAALLQAWEAGGVTRVTVRAEPEERGGESRAVDDFRRWEEEVADAAALLHASGIRSWGVELEFGRPRETFPDALQPARTLLELAVPQISLSEAGGRPVAGLRPGDGGSEPDQDRLADEYLALGALLESAGYEAWELTSFVRGGRIPLHFRSVWGGEHYLGLGPGAHSFDGRRRLWNLEDPDAYLSRVESERDPAAGWEEPGVDERRLERIWSGLRLAEGIHFDDLPSTAEVIQARWVEQGWARPDPHRLRLTRRGWLLLDGLAVELVSACTG